MFGGFGGFEEFEEFEGYQGRGVSDEMKGKTCPQVGLS